MPCRDVRRPSHVDDWAIDRLSGDDTSIAFSFKDEDGIIHSGSIDTATHVATVDGTQCGTMWAYQGIVDGGWAIDNLMTPTVIGDGVITYYIKKTVGSQSFGMYVVVNLSTGMIYIPNHQEGPFIPTV